MKIHCPIFLRLAPMLCLYGRYFTAGESEVEDYRNSLRSVITFLHRSVSRP